MLISNNKLGKKKKGFTLLEAIISFALISIMLIPIANMILSSVEMTKATEDKQQAKAVLQDTVENIKEVDKFPIEIGNEVYLPNDTEKRILIKRIEDVIVDGENKATFKVTSFNNDTGFSVEGIITENSAVNSDKTKNKLVDRAIYFSNGVISVSNNSSTIDSALKNAGSLAVEGDLVTIEVEDGKGINISYGNNQSKINIPIPENNALLIYLDDEKAKLKVNIKNESNTNSIKVYLCKGSKVSTRDDIILSNVQGQVDLITGVVKSSEESNTSIYSVELQAKKKDKVVETMNFDIIK